MTELTLDVDGTWRHAGQVVRHKRLSALLHRSVARGDGGGLVVTTGRDVMPFTAADAPKIIRAVERDDDGWKLLLLGGTEARLSPEAELLIDESGVIRSRVGDLWARWSRSASQALLADTDDELDEDGALRARLGALELRLRPTTARDWSR